MDEAHRRGNILALGDWVGIEVGKDAESSRVCISVWDDLPGKIRQKIPVGHVDWAMV